MTAVALRDGARAPRPPLVVYRDDGPLARALARVLGPALPVPPFVLVAAGGLPLLAAILAGVGDALAGAAVLWAVGLGAAAGERPHDRFAWAVPAGVRLMEYGGLLWLASRAGTDAAPGAFALLAALSFRHYDLVYRLRHRGEEPPGWLAAASGGWDGRLLVAWALAAAGGGRATFLALAAVLGVVFVAESVAGWTRFSRPQRDLGYEDEEDEGQ